VGAALGFDLEQYLAYRRDALVILHHATHETDHSALFHMTETYRAGAEGQEKTQGMLRAMTSLLEDLLLIQSGQTVLMRNIDLQAELTSIATSISFDWIERVARGIQEVQSGMRRNLIRSLALDAFAAGIAAR